MIAWSSASVWSTFNHDAVKALALQVAQAGMMQQEADWSRADFFNQQFNSAEGGDPPQPQMWYDQNWRCFGAYIQNDRFQRQEIYNSVFRRWHWRTGLEQLLFSHWNNDTPDHTQRYLSNRTRTLLLAGSKDNFNWTNIYSATKQLAECAVFFTPGNSIFLLSSGHSIHNERPSWLAQQIIGFLS